MHALWWVLLRKCVCGTLLVGITCWYSFRQTEYNAARLKSEAKVVCMHAKLYINMIIYKNIIIYTSSPLHTLSMYLSASSVCGTSCRALYRTSQEAGCLPVPFNHILMAFMKHLLGSPFWRVLMSSKSWPSSSSPSSSTMLSSSQWSAA